MKLCALTMVYRDYWALSQWYMHYSALLGTENLFIVVHGDDDSIAELCPGAHIRHIPRDDLTRFDKRRAVMLNEMSAELRKTYDWVIRTDADELITYDPDLHPSLADALSQDLSVPAVFALGLNLMQMPEDAPYDPSQPLGAQRRSIWFSGHYSKAIATCGAADLWRHGVKVIDRPFPEFPMILPRGLYLVHLKFANLAATQEADTVRMAVANPEDGREDGLPGDAWKYASDDTRKLLDEHYARTLVSWSRAERRAYRDISENPRRFRKIGLIKARSLKWDMRADMPDWLADTLAPLPAA